MGRKVKYSSKEKINAVKEYLDGKDSICLLQGKQTVKRQSVKNI